MSKKLYRSNDKVLGGVASGVAEYMDVDPLIVRIIWVVLCFAFGVGILAYILFWIFTPNSPRKKNVKK